MKTSASHPIQIAEVRPAPGLGRIGITFCPGKKDARSMSGPWDRDLERDLDVIRDWGCAVLVTLMESHEFELLGLGDIGEAATQRHMEWLHLPIVDVSVPGPSFERSWEIVGPGLRDRIRDGFDIVVHCRGGLGRAGTIAARLLVELGAEPQDAIRMVREVRPGAIETAEQENYVRGVRPAAQVSPGRDETARADRAIGALLGLAVGDAVGTTLEFSRRDSGPRLHDMVGGGPFGLRPGEWTDDTSMALALADSLLQSPPFDPEDLMNRFIGWWRRGQYSHRPCFDIGITTSSALSRFEKTGDAFSGSESVSAAGNGSLMRLSPVAIRFWSDADQRRTVAADQSRTTHASRQAVEACVAFADMLADAIEGAPRSQVLQPRQYDFDGSVQSIVSGSWRGRRRDDVASSGYVLHSLQAALWCVGRTSNFRDAVLLAANLGDDADTTAAVTGQLAGAVYGRSGIPGAWIEKLVWADRIERLAEDLFERC